MSLPHLSRTAGVGVAVLVTLIAAGVVVALVRMSAGTASAGPTAPAPSAPPAVTASPTAATATPTAGPTPTQAPGPTPTEGAPAVPAPEPVPTEGADTPALDPAPGTPQPDGVPLVLTVAAWDPTAAAVAVGAYAPDLVETGGTCTLTLTRSGRSVQATSSGAPDAATTSCGVLEVPGAELGPGRWTATVVYQSSSATRAAAPVTIEVP